jgi:hypothetical protein
MIAALWRWGRMKWYAHARHIDMDILWPVCLKTADNLDHAKAVFAVHAFNDPAWMIMGEAWIVDFIDSLEAYD